MPKRRNRYWLHFSRRASFPSFSGIGSIFIAGVNRISRDRLLMAFIGLFLLALLVINPGPASIYWAGVLILSLLVANGLATFAHGWLDKFPSPPVSSGVINIAAITSGLIVMLVVNWVILFGLIQLDFGQSIKVMGIVLIGYLIVFIIARAWQPTSPSERLKRWLVVTTQTLVLISIYQLGTESNVTNIGITLAAGLIWLVIMTSYQEGKYWATIKSS